MTTNTMLAPEMTVHLTTARDLEVSDLAVFTDYAGREVGCRVTRIWAAGVISTFAQVEVRICGLAVVKPYSLGEVYVVDADKVRRAI